MIGKLPTRWPWLFRAFRKYARTYAAKHLHAVRIAKFAPPPTSWTGPAIMVMNHPSWWDPIIGFVLCGLWPERLDFAPIESAALARYRFLGRVGLFGIEPDTVRGGREFLRIASAVLARDDVTLWITAQGKFTDPRERPVRLRSGVGHLAARLSHGVIIPIAVEYPFWDERTPEALVAFGEPIVIVDHGEFDARQWTDCISNALQSTQDHLSGLAQSRDAARFDTIVAGKTGVGGVYDLARRFRAWFRGERFHAGHGVPAKS